jgi:hypothetical protein
LRKAGDSLAAFTGLAFCQNTYIIKGFCCFLDGFRGMTGILRSRGKQGLFSRVRGNNKLPTISACRMRQPFHEAVVYSIAIL